MKRLCTHVPHHSVHNTKEGGQCHTYNGSAHYQPRANSGGYAVGTPKGAANAAIEIWRAPMHHVVRAPV